MVHASPIIFAALTLGVGFTQAVPIFREFHELSSRMEARLSPRGTCGSKCFTGSNAPQTPPQTAEKPPPPAPHSAEQHLRPQSSSSHFSLSKSELDHGHFSFSKSELDYRVGHLDYITPPTPSLSGTGSLHSQTHLDSYLDSPTQPVSLVYMGSPHSSDRAALDSPKSHIDAPPPPPGKGKGIVVDDAFSRTNSISSDRSGPSGSK